MINVLLVEHRAILASVFLPTELVFNGTESHDVESFVKMVLKGGVWDIMQLTKNRYRFWRVVIGVDGRGVSVLSGNLSWSRGVG